MISYITDSQLVEGLIAACVWGLFWIYLRNFLNLSPYLEGALSWILLWFCRKFGVTIYNFYKKKNNIKDFKIQLF
jgi:hypothetical protein